jgi:hypothetical protein
MAKHLLVLLAVLLAALLPSAAWSADGKEAADLATELATGESAARDNAEKKLRDLGAAAIPALRAAKPEKDEAVTRVRNVLTDIALDVAKVDPADAAMLHEIARDEGKGKRYSNAERLYRRAQKLFERLKDDAGDRGDRAKKRDFDEKAELCDRMKDKAGRKLKGETHTGVNLGFVRLGVEHDNSDEWE